MPRARSSTRPASGECVETCCACAGFDGEPGTASASTNTCLPSSTEDAPSGLSALPTTTRRAPVVRSSPRACPPRRRVRRMGRSFGRAACSNGVSSTPVFTQYGCQLGQREVVGQVGGVFERCEECPAEGALPAGECARFGSGGLYARAEGSCAVYPDVGPSALSSARPDVRRRRGGRLTAEGTD